MTHDVAVHCPRCGWSETARSPWCTACGERRRDHNHSYDNGIDDGTRLKPSHP